MAAAPTSSSASNPNVRLPLHGDRSKEHSIGANGQAHTPALAIITLYEGADRVSHIDFNEVFHKDCILSDPISNLKGVDAIKKRFQIFNNVLTPDVGAGHAPSEATLKLSVQKEGELKLRILLDKKMRCKVPAKLSAPGIGTDRVSEGEHMADKEGFEHLVFSTEILITLDSLEHRIVRLEDNWTSISSALGDHAARESLPTWFGEMEKQRRELTIEAVRQGW
jgi:hypothetical protein